MLPSSEDAEAIEAGSAPAVSPANTFRTSPTSFNESKSTPESLITHGSVEEKHETSSLEFEFQSGEESSSEDIVYKPLFPHPVREIEVCGNEDDFSLSSASR